jgi:F0F1-type ATP synthase alpha subunit
MGKPVQVDQDGNVSSGTSPQTNSDASRPIFVPIPKISDIGLINTPLVTGITAIDALTPIGKGQNMLVIGTQEKGTGDDDGTVNKSNKKAWMMNMLKSVVENDKDLRAKSGGGSNVRCFYGLTSSDSKARSTLMERLVTAGIKDDVVTLVATQSNGVAEDKMTRALEACEAVAVAATACTLGEHHAHTTGGDALVIVDDINLHKSLWDITTKQLVEIYGVDSVVKADLQGGSSSEMRGFFSGLIQRAARFKASKGGGSVTLILLSTLPSDEELNGGADNSEEEMVFDPSEFESMSEKIRTRIATLVNAKVPLTAANLRKIQIPVPRPSESEDAKRLALQHVEDLISMSDGQIWFDDELARSGRSPPLDPSRSIVSIALLCIFGYS